NNEYQLSPHPANNETTLYFNNQPGVAYELMLFRIDGIKIRTLKSSSNNFFIETSTLNNGFYIFLIKQGSTNYFINGQLIVRH
ncbi:MAG: T9SS type A sorting domain-containing protein, partial [Flavobacteriales bacterium]|nr:T9SS type A sorting domain-containing protein [Flavobacteriales bacterium]